MDTYIDKDIYVREFTAAQRRADGIQSREEAVQELKHIVEDRMTVENGEFLDNDLYGRGKKRVLFFHPQSPRAITRSLSRHESYKDSPRLVKSRLSSSFAKLFRSGGRSSSEEAWNGTSA